METQFAPVQEERLEIHLSDVSLMEPSAEEINVDLIQDVEWLLTDLSATVCQDMKETHQPYHVLDQSNHVNLIHVEPTLNVLWSIMFKDVPVNQVSQNQ